MTIGIAAYGPSAGEAVLTGVLGAELLGRGAIGGFAVFAVLDEDGRFHCCEASEGGVTALSIPAAWRRSRVAAVISSGPNRPRPLSQFLAGLAGVGLVTGHRLPNTVTPQGQSVNQIALEALAAGSDAQKAVDTALKGVPEVDAGLVAVTPQEDLGWANSARVARRSDLGEAHFVGTSCGFALLHNSIFVADGPCQRLADVLAGMIRQCQTGETAAHLLLRLGDPIRLQKATTDRIHIDAQNRIVALETANEPLLHAERVGTTCYLETEVLRDGLPVGTAATELIAKLDKGLATPLNQPAASCLLARRCDVTA